MSREIKELIKKVRDGDGGAARQLVFEFTPLITKVCTQLCDRYNNIIPLEEMINNGKQILIYLTLMEYDTNETAPQRARYPQFIRTHLHARLVQLYRPMISWRIRRRSLVDKYPTATSIYNELHERERHDLMLGMKMFMERTFNKREMELVAKFICNSTPRDQLAEKWGISKMRAKHIHLRAMEKLRDYLKKRGIKKYEDV